MVAHATSTGCASLGVDQTKENCLLQTGEVSAQAGAGQFMEERAALLALLVALLKVASAQAVRPLRERVQA